MEVAYVTTYDARDVKYWGGTPLFMTRTMEEQGITVDYVGPLTEKYPLVTKGKKWVYQTLLRKKYLRILEPFALKDYAKQAAQQIRVTRADVVLSPSSIPVAYLDCKQPFAFWTDATFPAMIDFYPEFTGLCAETLRHGRQADIEVFSRCSLAIYSSHWAAQTARDYYQIAPEKLRVVPYGANIVSPLSPEDVRDLAVHKSYEKCRLLFLAVDWLRKGGDIALEVTRELNRRGVPAELIVVGCAPEVEGPLPEFVRSLGFISKRTKEGQDRIDSLFAEAHFMILPTRADCNPMVFAEGNSFGLPSIGTDIGGIRTVIEDNISGKVFAKDATPEEYCDYLAALWADRARYRELSASAQHFYQTRLNWNIAIRDVKSILQSLL